ncbi:MAG TPA: sensor histidine kinase [Clostridiales bacterium]|nr:sensor histidine kinase [Clostridiales bacterium]
MTNKKSLASRGAAIFIAFVCANLAGAAALAYLAQTGRAGLSVYIALAVTAAANGILLWFLYLFFIKPYRRLKKLCGLFLDEQIYRELIEIDCEAFPGFQAVLKKFDELLDKQEAIKLSKRQAEYLALQNQINPHFLYNTLEAIRGDALSDGMTHIAETAEALATFFRYTITEMENLVTLEDEINNVENYFIIQKYRFGDKLQMKINIGDDEKKIYQLKLPKLTLQPIVENAVFHGLERKKAGGTVRINIETTGKLLLLSIVDDGLGIREELLARINEKLDKVGYIHDDRQSTSIALNNVSSRIKLLFGEEYGLHILSTPGVGTDVRITLPLITGDGK